jgi:hypothetical protein
MLRYGDTVAGSSLYYCSAGLSYTGGANVCTTGNPASAAQSCFNTDGSSSHYQANGNTGVTTPPGASTVSGTWRCLQIVSGKSGGYDGYNNQTVLNLYGGLFVRIA